VRLRGAVRIGLSYDDDLAPGKTLADFNMEAQGELLADYFALKHLSSSESMRQQRYGTSCRCMKRYWRASLPIRAAWRICPAIVVAACCI
jgi:hypothetical protein